MKQGVLYIIKAICYFFKKTKETATTSKATKSKTVISEETTAEAEPKKKTITKPKQKATKKKSDKQTTNLLDQSGRSSRHDMITSNYCFL